MNPDLWTIAYFAAGVLVGSVPPAIPIGRLWGVDVLAQGTRNPGLSNVKVLAGKTASTVTLVCDVAVGLLAAVVPYWIGGDVWDASLTCIGVLVGRGFSPWLGFKGGRAQMVTLATAVGLVPYAGVVFLSIFTVGVIAGQIAIANTIGLATLWVPTLIIYGHTWALAFALVAAAVGLGRRLLGTPDGGRVELMQRLLYDRERTPEPGEVDE